MDAISSLNIIRPKAPRPSVFDVCSCFLSVNNTKMSQEKLVLTYMLLQPVVDGNDAFT